MLTLNLLKCLKVAASFALTLALLTACPVIPGAETAAGDADKEPAAANSGRLVMFVGVDISGSFMRGPHFKDSLRFLAHYIFSHLHGYGGLTVPGSLFVGSIGGAKPDEPKTFFPIQTFQHRSIKEIEQKLFEIFPTNVENPFTDYNAFFEQIAVFVRNKKLVLKPITVVMLSDGVPDAPNKGIRTTYRDLKPKALENLARDITLRVLYTSAVVGMNWQTQVPRDRVKIWTQDANVMKDWKDKHILQPKKAFADQDRFFSWVKDNVDFAVPRKAIK